MEWLSYSLLITLLVLIIMGIGLIYIMLSKYWDTKIQAVGFLTLFFVVDVGIRLVEFVALLFNFNNLSNLYLDLNQIFPILFSLEWIIAAGIFLIFIEYYESESLPVVHVIVIFTLLSSFVTFTILRAYNMSLGNTFSSPIISPTPISFDFAPPIMISYLLIIAYPKLYRLSKEAQLKERKNSLYGLMLALFFLFAIPSLFITIANMFPFNDQLTIIFGTLIPRIGVLIGTLVLLVTYGRTTPAYLHNQKIEKLLVITKTGTPLYSLEFLEEPSTSRDDVLISGSLTAISGVLSESIEVTELESIDFKEKKILIEHQKQVGYFLITDRPSQFVWNALRSSASQINRQLNINSDADVPENQMIVDQEMDKTILEIFGMN